MKIQRAFNCVFKKSILFMIINMMLSIGLWSQSTEDLQREFVDLRFGAFIHFGIRTFTGGAWSEANQDVNAFNPSDLDCGQWADAFKAAGMKFGILTTKHHDGFCLWNSEFTENDIASSPWKGGEGDVVREYVDSFRAEGLEPALYYSIWDNTDGIGNGPITQDDMDYIMGQLTELLSNYGTIKLLFIDGWSWKMGHKSVPYDVIDSLVKTLQPECLLVDNTHLLNLYDNDMLHVEAGGTCPSDNTYPALLSHLIYTQGGNSWFWADDIPTATLMTANSIVNNLEYLEPRWCAYILNCPPNNEGKIDNNIVARLAEVGEAWSPDESRPPLPDQGPQIEHPVTPVSATATSGEASYAIDGLNDRYYYSVWESDAALPQSVTIDLGEEYSDVSILSYVPKYEPVVVPLTTGSIEEFKIYVSTDGDNFVEVSHGTWNSDTKMKVRPFEAVNAQYVRLEAVTARNDFAAVTEIAIGTGYTGLIPSSTKIIETDNDFGIISATPNPFSYETEIQYHIPESGHVKLEIVNITGQTIATLTNEIKNPGTYSIPWNMKNYRGNITSGNLFLCRLIYTVNDKTHISTSKIIAAY